MATRTEDLRNKGFTDRTFGNAKELVVASLGGEDPWQQIEEIREAGKRKARAAGIAYQMEHERHAVLARIASEVAQAHARENLSEAKLDRLARSDPRYQRHLEGTAAAIEEREAAESSYWALRSVLEWNRTAVAHENVLAQLGV